MKDCKTTSFSRIPRRGITAVLAMLYLVLFSALAIGFYAATTTSAQVSSNEQRASYSLIAAESGMDFLRYQLARTKVTAGLTDSTAVFDVLYANLQSQLDGTGNLGTARVSLSGDAITIPTIALDSDPNGARFSATITRFPTDIVASVTGRHRDADITRSVSLTYDRVFHKTTAFNYAIAAKGRVTISKSTITGTPSSSVAVMSASPDATALSLTGGSIGDANGGQVAVTQSLAQIAASGTVVHGTRSDATIKDQYASIVDAPEFPVVDTTIFKPYATNVYKAGGPYVNIRIPANTNPRFNGGDVIQGIMYVESPNNVTVRGNVTLQGFIVFENKGTDATNILDFSGSVNQTALPAGAQFDAMRSISGIYICAPTAFVKCWGSADFTMNGSLICSRLDMGGASTITLNKGSILALSPAGTCASFGSSKTVKFNSLGNANPPTAGLSYSQYFTPRAGSYHEAAE